MDFEGLESKEVLKHFIKLCEIPHGSYNIDQISDYLYGVAKNLGLWCKQDALKNVYIRKEATSGYEDVPPVLLQGHMDMVAVKEEDCDIDLEREGLRVSAVDGFLQAQGTSLGGDDGIAVAYALALLEADSVAHPAIEVLFTVNEEVGMEGAIGADLSVFRAERMMNIDSEEEGILLAGCAGGKRVQTVFSSRRSERTGELMQLSLKGFQGGHSGADIHKGRGNAVCVLARAVESLWKKYDISLVEIAGGEKDNAIPRFAHALICVPQAMQRAIAEEVQAITEQITQEYRAREPELQWRFGNAEVSQYPQYTGEGGIMVLQEQTARNAVGFLASVFDGVMTMSADIPGIVETSLNLGILSTGETEIKAVFALRSSKKTAKDNLAERLERIAAAFGAVVSQSGDYPAWEYRADSPLRDKMIRVYREQYGKEPVVTVIHAGLECGILLEKRPELDCVSFGPDIQDIHTTKERLDIMSVERTWKYLRAVLADKK